MKIWVLHSKIRHTANYFIITWNFLTVKIIFCIKKNDTKSVHPPEYISKSVQNAKSSDQKILTTYPSPIVRCTHTNKGPEKLLKKMTAKYDNIFSTYEHSWVCPNWFFFQTLFHHQRAQQLFFSKLEFWAEFFLDIHFITKVGSRGLWIHFLLQKCVKMAKN